MKLRDYVVLVIIVGFFLQHAYCQSWSKLTPATSEAPSPRLNGGGVYDAVGNRMVIFGGRNNGGSLNDVWAFDFNSNIWSDITPSDTNAPKPRFAHNAIYDSKKRRMIIWSGQLTGIGFFNDVWAFDLATETWNELTPDSGNPNKRYGAASVYDAETNRLVTFAGFTDQGRFNDTQAFDLDSNKWIDLTPSGIKPEIRCLLTASYDSLRHRMLIYAGQHSGPLDDIWEFDLTLHTWANITPTIKPEARFYSSSISTSTALVIFGGNNGSVSLNDTWSFDLTTNSWNEFGGDSAPPAQRHGHNAIYLPQDNSMIIFGGSGSELYNDIWKLNSIVTSVQHEPVIPQQSTLSQNYPNPFNPSTTISYALAISQYVTLKIYNILGKELLTLVNAYQPAGAYSVRFEPMNTASGLYVYRLQTNVQVLTRSMMFLK